MPTWVSADRTAQRGCEPRAINPLQREKRERGRFLAPAILAQNEIFSIRLEPAPPIRVIFATKSEGIQCPFSATGRAFLDARSVVSELSNVPLPGCQSGAALK